MAWGRRYADRFRQNRAQYRAQNRILVARPEYPYHNGLGSVGVVPGSMIGSVAQAVVQLYILYYLMKTFQIPSFRAPLTVVDWE